MDSVRLGSLVIGLLLMTLGAGAIFADGTSVSFGQVLSVGLFLSGCAFIAVVVSRRLRAAKDPASGVS